MESVLLALKLKHEFGISLTLFLAASNDPFNDFNGSKVMLRVNSFTKPLNIYSICQPPKLMAGRPSFQNLKTFTLNFNSISIFFIYIYAHTHIYMYCSPFLQPNNTNTQKPAPYNKELFLKMEKQKALWLADSLAGSHLPMHRIQEFRSPDSLSCHGERPGP